MNILDIAIAKKLAGGGGGSGTDNYNDLSNLPKINDTTLSGNKSSSALGLQSEINSDNKLASDLVDDTNQNNKFVTSTEKNTWNAKQNAIDADHKLSSDLVDDANKTNKFVTSTEKQTWNNKQNAIDSDHKLSSDLVDDANKTNKFVTSTEKNTWNNKQNAIDADHKLSSSLVSFTTAEAAALASGIDSSKVEQIGTNQTNILYGIKTGAKNQLKLTGTVYNPNTLYVYWDYENGTVRVTGSTPTTDTVFINLGTWTAPEDDTYRMYANSEACTANIRVYDNGTWGTYTAEYSNVATWTKGTTRTLYLRIAKNTVVGDITVTPMICPKSIFDADPTFAPPALPNYDLTRLEAEDRAALTDVVDSGAKNELQPSWTTQEINGVKFTVGSDGVITVTTTGTRTSAAIYPLLSRYSGTKMVGKVMSISPKGGSNASYYVAAEQADSPWHNVGTDYGDGVVISSEANNKDINVNIVIPANYSPNNLKFYPMICTKAAFGVSSKFVPYRPNWDLVSQYTSIPRTKIAYCDASGDSKTHKYTMQFSDFTYAQFTDTQTCGSYLVSVVTWGYTPKHGLWIVSYSGGNRTYTALTNIVGADAATVSVVTDDGIPYIQVVASGKVTISTLN